MMKILCATISYRNQQGGRDFQFFDFFLSLTVPSSIDFPSMIKGTLNVYQNCCVQGTHIELFSTFSGPSSRRLEKRMLLIRFILYDSFAWGYFLLDFLIFSHIFHNFNFLSVCYFCYFSAQFDSINNKARIRRTWWKLLSFDAADKKA